MTPYASFALLRGEFLSLSICQRLVPPCIPILHLPDVRLVQPVSRIHQTVDFHLLAGRVVVARIPFLLSQDLSDQRSDARMSWKDRGFFDVVHAEIDSVIH